MIKKFVEDRVRLSGPFNRVLFLSTVIMIMCIGFYVYSEVKLI